MLIQELLTEINNPKNWATRQARKSFKSEPPLEIRKLGTGYVFRIELKPKNRKTPKIAFCKVIGGMAEPATAHDFESGDPRG
jgi:hypothetical protein